MPPVRSGESTGSTVERRLLDAAEELFLRDGYSACATDAICAQAHASKESLYSHFGGKEGLFAAVVERVIDETVPTISHDAGAGNLHEELVEQASVLLRTTLRPRFLDLVRVVAAESPRHPGLGMMLRSALGEHAFRSAAGILRRHREVSVPAAHVWARMFVGGLLSYAFIDALLSPDEEVRPPTRARVRAHVDLSVQAAAAIAQDR